MRVRKTKTCPSRSRVGLASWSAPHRCKLRPGHKGSHQCGDRVAKGSSERYRPCKHTWENRMARKARA